MLTYASSVSYCCCWLLPYKHLHTRTNYRLKRHERLCVPNASPPPSNSFFGCPAAGVWRRFPVLALELPRQPAVRASWRRPRCRQRLCCEAIGGLGARFGTDGRSHQAVPGSPLRHRGGGRSSFVYSLYSWSILLPLAVSAAAIAAMVLAL